MKRIKIFQIIVSTSFCGMFFFSCGSLADNAEQKEENKITEVVISACGVTDPLQNLEWLKEFCENLIETQNFSIIKIDLYKVVDTDDFVFKISISYSELDDSPVSYSEYWRNCIGDLICIISSGVPPIPGLVEEFIKDKEFVANLLHFTKRK